MTGTRGISAKTPNKKKRKTDKNKPLLEHCITHAASKLIPDELYGFQRNKQSD